MIYVKFPFYKQFCLVVKKSFCVANILNKDIGWCFIAKTTNSYKKCNKKLVQKNLKIKQGIHLKEDWFIRFSKIKIVFYKSRSVSSTNEETLYKANPIANLLKRCLNTSHVFLYYILLFFPFFMLTAKE